MTVFPHDEVRPEPTVEHCGVPAGPAAAAMHHLLHATLRPVGRLIMYGTGSAAARHYRLADHVGSLLRPPAGTRCRPVLLPNCGGEWVSGPDVAPPRGGDGAVLYFHGGAFIVGGLRSHRRLAANLSAVARLPVLNVDYRQLPAARLRTSVADGVDAYRHLLDAGHPAEKIVLGGDSAGGCLAFAVAVAIAGAGLPAPAGIVGLSPWLDLDCGAKLTHPNADIDPVLTARGLGAVVRHGIAEHGRLDPALSPVNADLSGLPPVLIQVGSTEIFRGDAELMADRLAAHHVSCRVQLWERQPHCFHLAAGLLPAATRAVAELGAFIRTSTAKDQRNEA